MSNVVGGYQILDLASVAINTGSGKTVTVDVPESVSDAIYSHKPLLVQNCDVRTSTTAHVYSGFATKYYNGGLVHQKLLGVDMYSPASGQLTITIE